MNKPLYIYVAGAYTQGDAAQNVTKAIKVGNHLLMRGHFPFVPHLAHHWNSLHPQTCGIWIRYGLGWTEKCDALVRLQGYSKGADGEVNRMKELGRPVFYLRDLDLESILELDRWLDEL